MNNYRVDRIKKNDCPVGMNSIVYIGDDEYAARNIFREAPVGLDAWNQPNGDYGVGLFKWNNSTNQYTLIGFRK